MIRMIIKEIILVGFFFMAGIFGFNFYEIEIFHKWIIFSVLLLLFFISGTAVFNYLLSRKISWMGLAFAGITFLHQLILLLLLLIFLEPEETIHRIVAKVGIAVYLIAFGIDTFWKLKWIFPPVENEDSTEVK